MTKKERMIAAIEGRTIDTVPACFSMHFPLDRNAGQAAVDEHLRFFQETDTDVLKLMNENMMPDVGPIRTPEDWKQVPVLSSKDDFMVRQLDLVKRILDASDASAFRVGTLHGTCSYTQSTLRNYMEYPDRRELLSAHLRANKRPVLDAMQRITDVLCEQARDYVEAGLDGVYYAAIGGERHYFTDEEFDEFIRPFDMQILKAIREAGGYTMLHICKDNNNMQRYADYADLVDVINWGVYETSFSLEEGRKLFPNKVLMGGFANHPDSLLVKGPENAIRAEAARLVKEMGHKGFMLGADCTLPTGIPYSHIRAAVDGGRD